MSHLHLTPPFLHLNPVSPMLLSAGSTGATTEDWNKVLDGLYRREDVGTPLMGRQGGVEGPAAGLSLGQHADTGVGLGQHADTQESEETQVMSWGGALDSTAGGSEASRGPVGAHATAPASQAGLSHRLLQGGEYRVSQGEGHRVLYNRAGNVYCRP